MAKIIPVLWCSALLAATAPRNDLASVVKAWREAPTPARRSAVESYAAAHPAERDLALLALGIGAYEQKDYTAAIDALRKVQTKLPKIADYPAYYLAASQVETDQTAEAPQAAHTAEVKSPLSGKAWIVEARAFEKTDASQSVRILREHYAELPQPEGDLELAASYQAAKDLSHAVDFYQRVYYQYISGEPAGRSAAALLALKDLMGADYPAPLPGQLLQRASRLMDVHDYSAAKSEFQSAATQSTGLAHDQAVVRAAEADYLAGNRVPACSLLRGLDLAPSEADAERLYYLVECARRLVDDDAMMASVKRLAKEYPKSPWRLKALVSAANRFLLVNRPDDYVPLYQAAYGDFPADPVAGLSHWKVTFQAYLRGKNDAEKLLREHLRNYPLHATTGAALYFLGRLSEQNNDAAAAVACYRRLTDLYGNTYYAMLAREHLAHPELHTVEPSASTTKFLADLKPPQPRPVPALATPETQTRIERSRLLRTAGLDDLADAELRFGARTDGQPVLLGIEIAAGAEAPHRAMRVMKSMSGDYLSMSVDDAPRKFWDLLFPLPYRDDLLRGARQNGLDPALLAGLIRQESEFNPEAVSSAKAYGLTQVRPGTGRLFARRAGIQRFTPGVLFQPTANLKIGSSILKSMLDEHGGHIEQTLAAYNAGPNRAAEWSTWASYREPAEFVESIPFTETRDYVQAVLRNAEMYRKLYPGLSN